MYGFENQHVFFSGPIVDHSQIIPTYLGSFEFAIRSCGWSLIDPSGRLEAFSSFARGSPEKDIRFGKPFSLFLIR